jgi:hypothetical protein
MRYYFYSTIIQFIFHIALNPARVEIKAEYIALSRGALS